MSSTFSTVNGKLLTDVTTEIPQWIADIDFQPPRMGGLKVDFDQRTVNARCTAAKRDGMTGHTRLIRSAFTETTLRTAALTRLAGFLSGHRFTVVDVAIGDGEVVVTASIDQRPCEYEFTYMDVVGRLEARPTFKTVSTGVDGQKALRTYPFTAAGLSDSLEDDPALGTATPVVIRQAVGGKSTMTRMEIIRRCGNRLTVAKEAIQRSLDEGLIVAVGSNEYASIYDMACLFPDLNSAPVREATHTAEFVPNRVATASHERKSDDRLCAEVAALLGRTLDLRSVDDVARDGDALLVRATVAINNVRRGLHFEIAMDGERLGAVQMVEDEDGERMSMQQLLSRTGDDARLADYLRSEGARGAQGYVYSLRAVHRALGGFLRNVDVDQLVDDWCAHGYAQRLRTTTVASRYTLNELLRLANVQLLSEEDVRRVRADRAFFGQGLRVDRVEGEHDHTRPLTTTVHERDVRAQFDELLPPHVVCLSCDAVHVDGDGAAFLTRCLDRRTGISRVLDVAMDCVDGRLTNPRFAVGGQHVDLDTAFVGGELVREVAARRGEVTAAPVRFTIRQLAQLVDGLVDRERLADVVRTWVDTGAATLVDSHTLVSRSTLADLLEASNLVPFDAETRAQVVTAKGRLGDLLIDRVDVADGDTRTRVAGLLARERMEGVLDAVNAVLTHASVHPVGDGRFALQFHGADGAVRRLTATAHFDGARLVSLVVDVAGQPVPIADLPRRFAASPLLRAYVRTFGAQSTAHRGLISRRRLLSRLGNLLTDEDAKRVVEYMVTNGLLTEVDDGYFAGKLPMEDLLRLVDVQVDDHCLRLALVNGDRTVVQRFERVAVQDGDARRPTAQVTPRQVPALFAAWLPRNFTVLSVDQPVVNEARVEFGTRCLDRVRGVTARFRVHADVANGRLVNVQLLQGSRSVDLATGFVVGEVAELYGRVFGVDSLGARRLVSLPRLRANLARVADVTDLDQVVDGWVATGAARRVGTDELAVSCTLAELLSNSPLQALPVEQRAAELRRAATQRALIPRADHVADPGTRTAAPVLTSAAAERWFITHSEAAGVQVRSVDGVTIDDGRLTLRATLCSSAGLTAPVELTADVDGDVVVEDTVALTTAGRPVGSLTACLPRSAAAELVAEKHGDAVDRHLWTRRALAAVLEPLIADADGVVDTLVDGGWLVPVDGDRLAAEASLPCMLAAVNAQPLTPEQRAAKVARGVDGTRVPLAVHEQGGVRVAVDGRTDDQLMALKGDVSVRLERLIAAGRVTDSRVEGLRTQLSSAGTVDQLRAVVALIDRYDGR